MGDPKRMILVVGRSRPSTDALRDLLEHEGHSALVLNDPSEGARRAAEPEVAAVILDLESELATGDGLALLRQLRATPSRLHLPVIVLAPGEERRGRISALEQGADDVLGKPWDPDELLARLGRSLQVRDRFEALSTEAEHLRELSVTDGLTQVHNHRFFEERLRDEFRRAQRYDDPLSLILLDVDHFKDVNDQFGHLMGDQVLRAVAEAIRQSVRDTDLVARYGGEEFAVLLPKTHLAGALTVADRVWRGVGALSAGPAGALRVTASLGVSGFPGRPVLSAEQLVRSADEALYRAKREGRNRICVSQQRDPPSNHPSEEH